MWPSAFCCEYELKVKNINKDEDHVISPFERVKKNMKTLQFSKALFTLQLLTWVKLNLGSTRGQPTFVYTAFITKCSVNAKLG